MLPDQARQILGLQPHGGRVVVGVHADQAAGKSGVQIQCHFPLRVIEQAQIERTYGHQLFNGTRRPSRDKVLQLALGMGLNVDETQQLLRAALKSPLYPRLKRDAVVLFGLQKGLPLLAVQESLTKYGLSLLGGQKGDG